MQPCTRFILPVALTIVGLCLLVSALPSACAEKNPLADKKLIEYGWDVPSSRFVRQNIARMETIPFDGVVIKILPKPDSNEAAEPLGWKVWTRTRFAPDQYEHAIADLKATKFTRFTDNFIQVVSAPADIDWFDPEWSSVAYNAACLARVAKLGGCKGIMLDPEDYGNCLWGYTNITKKLNDGRSFEEYTAKIKERGREFMRAINREYPDITILSLVGPSLSCLHRNIKEDRYGMLYAFFEGMCEVATPQTTIIDGYEQSYPFRELSQYQYGRQIILQYARNLVQDRASFTRHMRAGFGVWADYDSGRIGWHPDCFAMNYFTPEELRATLSHALRVSDKYVWVYSERLKWWDFNVPSEYRDALALAKTGPGEVTSKPMQKIALPRDGWRFSTDESNVGQKRGWCSPDFDDSNWQEIRIDNYWEPQIDRDYDGVGWYRRKFTTPEIPPGKTVYLAVGAADEVGWLWLNGRLMGGHYFGEGSSNSPFAVDVTDYLKSGAENSIAVRVYDPLSNGGMWQPMQLLIR